MSVRAALLSRLPQRIARLGADQSGVSTIELAIFLPILATLITGAVDLGQGLSQQFTLQQAVNRSLEMVQARQFTAAAGASQVNYNFLVTEAASAAKVPVGKVSLRKWLECDGVTKTDYETLCETGEDSARYLELRIATTYESTILFTRLPMVVRGAVRIQ
jgi:Flp pilus assembly protein TadG